MGTLIACVLLLGGSPDIRRLDGLSLIAYRLFFVIGMAAAKERMAVEVPVALGRFRVRQAQLFSCGLSVPCETRPSKACDLIASRAVDRETADDRFRGHDVTLDAPQQP